MTQMCLSDIDEELKATLYVNFNLLSINNDNKWKSWCKEC